MEQQQAAAEGERAAAQGGERLAPSRWAALYAGESIAVVTSLGRPPLPPDGYVPLRYGLPRPAGSSSSSSDNNGGEGETASSGFSLDTLLWNEKLLEERILQLTEWTRRAPPAPREKLARINRMVNRCNTTDNQVL